MLYIVLCVKYSTIHHTCVNIFWCLAQTLAQSRADVIIIQDPIFHVVQKPPHLQVGAFKIQIRLVRRGSCRY